MRVRVRVQIRVRVRESVRVPNLVRFDFKTSHELRSSDSRAIKISWDGQIPFSG